MPFHPLALLLAVPIAVLLAVVTGSHPTDLTGIAAIITACIGVCGFLVTLLRGKRNNKRVEGVEEAASYVKGFQSLIDNLQTEIKDLQGEMTTIGQTYSAEREQFDGEIRSVKTELIDAQNDRRVAQAELMELKGSVRGFLTADQWAAFQKRVE